MYPNELENKFGKNIRVIFITRAIKSFLILLKNIEAHGEINKIKRNYKIYIKYAYQEKSVQKYTKKQSSRRKKPKIIKYNKIPPLLKNYINIL